MENEAKSTSTAGFHMSGIGEKKKGTPGENPYNAFSYFWQPAMKKADKRKAHFLGKWA